MGITPNTKSLFPSPLNDPEDAVVI